MTNDVEIKVRTSSACMDTWIPSTTLERLSVRYTWKCSGSDSTCFAYVQLDSGEFFYKQNEDNDSVWPGTMLVVKLQFAHTYLPVYPHSCSWNSTGWITSWCCLDILSDCGNTALRLHLSGRRFRICVLGLQHHISQKKVRMNARCTFVVT